VLEEEGVSCGGRHSIKRFRGNRIIHDFQRR